MAEHAAQVPVPACRPRGEVAGEQGCLAGTGGDVDLEVHGLVGLEERHQLLAGVLGPRHRVPAEHDVPEVREVDEAPFGHLGAGRRHHRGLEQRPFRRHCDGRFEQVQEAVKLAVIGGHLFRHLRAPRPGRADGHRGAGRGVAHDAHEAEPLDADVVAVLAGTSGPGALR
jgi:hypothetical protein